MPQDYFVEALRQSGIEGALHLADRLDGHTEALAASVPEGVPTAVIATPNLIIQEGTKSVRIPVTIATDDDQTVQLIQLMMTVENIRNNQVAAPMLAEHPDAIFQGSVFNHRTPDDLIRYSVPAQGIVLGGPWTAPFGDIPADGLVFSIAVDTTQLVGGQTYRIKTSNALSCATWLPPDTDPGAIWFHNLILSHHEGTISVRGI